MKYVYLAMAAAIAFMFAYRKISSKKRSSEYYSDDDKKEIDPKK